MESYDTFREILDAHPSGAPKSKAFEEILRILFSPEDIEVVLHMSFRPKRSEDIARSSSIPVEEVERRLEGMAERAVIFCREKDGEKTYGLLPTIPGLFEFPFMKGGGTPEHRRLAALWEEYHREAMGAAFCGNPTPLARIVPVEKSLTAGTRIHPYEEVSSLIENSKYIAVANCACRVSVGRCNAPLEMCLIFDAPARFLVHRGYAREIDREEARSILDRAEDAGLVHTSNNSTDRASFICNCCSCCCTILRARNELHHPHAFLTSSYEARIDPDRCTGCGDCEERCPVGAIKLDGERAVVEVQSCIGCGLCVTGCPSDALELVAREEAPDVPGNAQEMGLKVLREKGKLEAFMKVMGT